MHYPTLSEQLAHSAVDLHLKKISAFLHDSEMNKNPTLPWWKNVGPKEDRKGPAETSHGPFSLNCLSTVESDEPTPE